MDPQTGTFLSVDPVVPQYDDPQTLNAYAYAGNNPVSYIDPTGMAQMDCYGNCGGTMYFSGPNGSFAVPFTPAQTSAVSTFAARFDAAGGNVSVNGIDVSFGSPAGGGMQGAGNNSSGTVPESSIAGQAAAAVANAPSGSGFPGDPAPYMTVNENLGPIVPGGIPRFIVDKLIDSGTLPWFNAATVQLKFGIPLLPALNPFFETAGYATRNAVYIAHGESRIVNLIAHEVTHVVQMRSLGRIGHTLALARQGGQILGGVFSGQSFLEAYNASDLEAAAIHVGLTAERL